MQDLKMTDQVAWHQNDGPSKSRGVKMQDMKMQDLKMQDYFMFGVKSFTAQNLNSNLKHHNYELKHPCTRSVLRH